MNPRFFLQLFERLALAPKEHLFTEGVVTDTLKILHDENDAPAASMAACEAATEDLGSVEQVFIPSLAKLVEALLTGAIPTSMVLTAGPREAVLTQICPFSH